MPALRRASQSHRAKSRVSDCEGLPGVGPETARKLVSHFGSPRAVFAAGAQQLRRCKGIGPKTADSIAAALDLRPTAYRQTKGTPAAQD